MPSTPVRGADGTTPARRPEAGFVTGNGRLGAMLSGNPANEKTVMNPCRLFLPLDSNREIVPDLGKYVPERWQVNCLSLLWVIVSAAGRNRETADDGGLALPSWSFSARIASARSVASTSAKDIGT